MLETSVSCNTIPCCLCLGQCRLSLFQCVPYLICELVNCFNSEQRLVQFKAHLRMPASVKEERSQLYRQVDVIVVEELCKQKEHVPVVFIVP